MRDALEEVEVSADLIDYVVALVRATREHRQIQVGASPRGGLAIVQLARGQALLRLRDYVIPDDIKSMAVPALAHRITLRPELWVRQVQPDDVVAAAAGQRADAPHRPVRRPCLTAGPGQTGAAAADRPGPAGQPPPRRPARNTSPP